MIIQHTWHFWYEKLKEQVALINKKKKNESLERFFVLDIALAYIFLHLFLESTIEQIIWELNNRINKSEFSSKYSKNKRRFYLKDRLDFIFSSFCGELPFKDLVKLREIVKDLIGTRNSIIHLEEISWKTDYFKEMNGPLKEKPTRGAEKLTVNDLKNNYDAVRDFFVELKKVLNRAFDNKEIEVEYTDNNYKEIKKRNFIDYAFENVVFEMPEFEDIK